MTYCHLPNREQLATPAGRHPGPGVGRPRIRRRHGVAGSVRRSGGAALPVALRRRAVSASAGAADTDTPAPGTPPPGMAHAAAAQMGRPPRWATLLTFVESSPLRSASPTTAMPVSGRVGRASGVVDPSRSQPCRNRYSSSRPLRTAHTTISCWDSSPSLF